MRMRSKKLLLAVVPLAGWLWGAPAPFADDEAVMEKKHEAEQKALESKHETEHEAADQLDDVTKRQERRLEKKHEVEQKGLEKKQELEQELTD